MKTVEFDYNLPLEQIAQKPCEPRDHSLLMVVDKNNKKIEHKHFFDIIDYLRPGDLLVWNNSKVFKARLFGKLEPFSDDLDQDGKKDKPMINEKSVEIFLVREMENPGVWKVLAKPGRHVKPGMKVRFAPDFFCEVMVKEPEGTILVQFPDNAETVRNKANKYGHIPVPPYVKDEPDQLDTYQTVYSKEEGSVAAPTAGFHFTSELIEKLKNKGIDFAEVTLHVGLGTFLPVKAETIEDHTMHSEWVELTAENANKINQAKTEGRRVIAVGTTTVRTLEGIALYSPLEGGARRAGGVGRSQLKITANTPQPPSRGGLRPYHGDINIFISPGFEFQVIDAMITNFHLPKSTLLMLVSAFNDNIDFTLDCYKIAVAEKYRFFSFGDAMFIC